MAAVQGTGRTRAAAIVAGMLADRIIPDPPTRVHPVALFGSYVSRLEKRLYRDSRGAGAVLWAAAVIPPVAATTVLAARWPASTTAISLWACLGGSLLEKTGQRMSLRLDAGDLAGARELVPWLCSRDPELLDFGGIARATVESLAENTSDAAIASLFWAGVGGAPAVVAHRCINTLDAMVGYRNPRYRNFGWASAKIDDLAAWFPARLTASVHTGIATTRGHGAAALRAWREDAPQHPSPNAGPVEATAAAALGVSLGGRTVYAHGVEQRPVMGRGPAPTTVTVGDAVALSRDTQIASTAVAVVLAMVVPGAVRRLGRILGRRRG